MLHPLIGGVARLLKKTDEPTSAETETLKAEMPGLVDLRKSTGDG